MSNQAITSAHPSHGVLYQAEIGTLKANVSGEVILPGDAAYDEARTVWNGMIDRYPSCIVRCTAVADVITAVGVARQHRLLVAVRGGGHSAAGYSVCDGGIVIDLSRMRAVDVDPQARTARVEGGATWADVDRSAQAYGLAAPGGLVSDTGVAGLTLGGGLGWLRRKHGLSCDSLLAVQIVTADGELRTASETENADLFWAVRGGGGNFGIVTSFQFRLYPVGPSVMFAAPMYRAKDARAVLQRWRDYTATCPDEVTSMAIFGTIPEVEEIPEPVRGTPGLILLACYAGPVEEGERAVRPLREFDTPVADLSGPMPYMELQTFFDEDYPTGRQYYWKSRYLNGLDDDLIDLIAARAASCPSALSTLDLWHLGGAMSRVPYEETAFGYRDAPYLLGIESNWTDLQDSEQNVAWSRQVWSDTESYSGGGMYLNFPGHLEEGETVLRNTFGPIYDRLVDLKRKYDPNNLFRLNQNIPPTTAQ